MRTSNFAVGVTGEKQDIQRVRDSQVTRRYQRAGGKGIDTGQQVYPKPLARTAAAFLLIEFRMSIMFDKMLLGQSMTSGDVSITGSCTDEDNEADGCNDTGGVLNSPITHTAQFAIDPSPTLRDSASQHNCHLMVM
jgi:hypothetical protein